MNKWMLLRVMVAKEMRTTFRERNQMLGLAVSVLILILVLGSSLYQAVQHSHSPAAPPFQPGVMSPDGSMHPLSPPELAAMHWVGLGIATVVGVFFSLGYLISATVASFVGEKEARTLEILLASPITDRALFFTKCISVLVPAAAIGYLFAAMATLLAFVFLPAPLLHLPPSILWYALVLSVPVMVLPQLWLVGLGAAVSAKAETVKGAGQVMGVVFMLFFFGLGYGLPLLLQAVPSLRPPLLAAGRAWLNLPFLLQYGILLAALGIPALLFMGIARSLFRRDRMLS